MADRETAELISVEEYPEASSLKGDHLAGDTTLTIVDGRVYSEGGRVRIAGDDYDYTREDSTLTIDPGLVVDVADGESVTRLSSVGEPESRLVAHIDFDGDDEEGAEAEVRSGDRAAFPEGSAAAGMLVYVDETTYGYEVSSIGYSGALQAPLWEDADSYVIDAADVAAGGFSHVLLHAGVVERSIDVKIDGVGQSIDILEVDHVEGVVEGTLPSWLPAGAELTFHYQYLSGAQRSLVDDNGYEGEWLYLQVADNDGTNRSAVAFDDTSWSTGQAPFGNAVGNPYVASGKDWPAAATYWATLTAIWVRKHISAPTAASIDLLVRYDNRVYVYWNGAQVAYQSDSYAGDFPVHIPAEDVLDENVLAVRCIDLGGGAGNQSYLDVSVTVIP